MSDEFENVVSGQFGATEKQLGPEAYQVNLEHGKAMVKHVEAGTAQIKARTSVMTTVAAFGLILVVLTMLPVFVWLWKWAV